MQEYIHEEVAIDLLSFIERSPSAFHAVKSVTDKLLAAGYVELQESENWELKPGCGYFVTRNLSSIIAFRIPEKEWLGFSIAASHSDFPSFKVKEHGEITASDFTRLNTEKYGGMICSTWLDRPLSVAGRVMVEEDGKLVAKLVNIDRDLLLIPNVAIHMNRNLNDGYKFNPACDTLPLFGECTEPDCFKKVIAEAAGVTPDKVLGQDLFLYARTPGSIWGASGEYISSRSLDNLQCAYSSLQGFLAAEPGAAVPVYATFDNEEVGSSTRQGAGSTFLFDTLRRIAGDVGEEGFRRLLANSFLLSCDNAHAVHPNHPEFSDGQNKVKVNGGVVLKFNAAQRYTTDSVSESLVKFLCKREEIPLQYYANRSDIAGGSTLGGIATTKVSVSSADVGLAQLAMHSAYETAGIRDTACMIELCRAFFGVAFAAEKDGSYRIV